MATKTITIELRVDYDTPEKEALIVKAAKRAAKHLYTTALLVKDQRQPQIALSSGDMFTAKEELLLDEVEELTDDTTDEAAPAGVS